MPWDAFFRVVPYLIAGGLALSSLSSRVLSLRFANVAHKDRIEFAKMWTSASDLITLPLISLGISISRIGRAMLIGSEQGVEKFLAALVVSSVVVLAMVLRMIFVVARGEAQWVVPWKLAGVGVGAGLDFVFA